MSIAEVQARMATITAQFMTPSQVTAASGAAFATELAKASSAPASAPASAPTSVATTVTGSAASVITEAKSYLGVPYVWGGTNPKTGLDCSGLTQLVYRHAGVELPRVSWEQAKSGTAVDGLANAKPGDLLAFSTPVDHVAIYLGDNKMIHAPKPGRSVEISEVYETPTAIRRVLPETPALTLPAGLLANYPALANLGGLPA